MKRNFLFLLLVLIIGSCSMEYVKDDLGVYRLVIKDQEFSSDSLTQLNYFLCKEPFLVEKLSFRGGHLLREITTYRKTGMPLSYRAYQNSQLLYFRLYNASGGVRKVDGNIIISGDSVEVNNVIIDERYLRPVRFLNPPNTKIEYIIGDEVGIPIDDRNLEKHPMQFYEVNDTISFYAIQFNKIGIFRKELHWRCEDIINGNVQKGKNIHQYNVVDEIQN